MVADAYRLMEAVLALGVDSEAVKAVLQAVERGELSAVEAVVALERKGATEAAPKYYRIRRLQRSR